MDDSSRTHAASICVINNIGTVTIIIIIIIIIMIIVIVIITGHQHIIIIILALKVTAETRGWAVLCGSEVFQPFGSTRSFKLHAA